MVVRPPNDLRQEPFVGFGGIPGGPTEIVISSSSTHEAVVDCSRREISLHAEGPVSFSLLFGLFEDQLLNVAVHLVLLHATGDR